MMQSAMLPIVSATAALRKSEQQRKRRHQDKAFLADYSKGASMTEGKEDGMCTATDLSKAARAQP